MTYLAEEFEKSRTLITVYRVIVGILFLGITALAITVVKLQDALALCPPL
jgi:hypothetical protein